jgi:hypothetical protein
MITVTAAELQKVQDEIHHDQRTYAPDPDRFHDRYGNDTRDHVHTFDHNHIEDVFPY